MMPGYLTEFIFVAIVAVLLVAAQDIHARWFAHREWWLRLPLQALVLAVIIFGATLLIPIGYEVQNYLAVFAGGALGVIGYEVVARSRKGRAE